MNRDAPKKIVITGVTRGLGRALTEEFIRLGHRVFGCARTKVQIAELAERYPQHDFKVVDVASHHTVSRWSAYLLKRFGAPDLLINNAGVFHAKSPIWRATETHVREEIEVNLLGACNTLRSFIPAMLRRKRGAIINIGSRWGFSCEQRMGAYCAAKWALVALTKVLAEELKPSGVIAVVLNPGTVKTDMLRRYLDAGPKDPRLASYPTPQDWGKVAAPLILRQDRADNGKVLKVHLPLSPRRASPKANV